MKEWSGMNEDERREWGRQEMQLRQSDIADVKSGLMALEQAQSRAQMRRMLIGAYHADDVLYYVR